jgi:predicted HicB family RNase H-like nuclease/CheY-like chemotaxis protein
VATFLLSNDPQLTIRTAMTLKAQGLDCQPFATASEVSAAARELLPDAVLVDLSERRRERVRLLSELRRSYPAAQIPLIVFRPGAEASESDLSSLSIDLEVDLQNIPPSLSSNLKALISRLEERPAGQAHPYALETLARVWRQGLSGELVLGRQKVLLCEGGLVNSSHLPILERGLLRGGLQFSPSSVSALGDWYSVGMALWNAARTRTTEDFYVKHQNLVLKARPNSSRTDALPLGEATQQLLSNQRREQTLRRHLSALKLQPKMVEQDLEVLYLLGLYRFVARTRSPRTQSHLQGLPPPSATRSMISATRSYSSSTMGRKGVDDQLKTRLLLKRLRREVETLSSADEWTVLGIQPTEDINLVTQAGERMASRYRNMAAETTIEEARTLADTLRVRAEEAARVLTTLVEVFQTYGTPSDPHCREEVAFRKGLAMLLQDELGMSMRLFSAACDERMQSPRNLAYLGWSTFRHKGEAAREEALELLQLSESLNNSAATTQLFLASIEDSAGEQDRAEERLGRLIRRGNASDEVHALYRKVRHKMR